MTKDLIIGILSGFLGAIFLLAALAAWVQERKRDKS